MWAGAIIGVDFLFYVFHRAAHTIALVWATHIVHHQPRRFNLTAAMRNGFAQRLFAAWFFAPLALLGLPLAPFLGALGVSLVYQFLLHTRFVAGAGRLGWVFNTPSHHRVHHGVEPAYVNKNFGGIFIVWDRLLGTFCAEAREPSYGVSDAMPANPLWANAAPFVDLGARLASSPRRALSILFGPP